MIQRARYYVTREVIGRPSQACEVDGSVRSNFGICMGPLPKRPDATPLGCSYQSASKRAGTCRDSDMVMLRPVADAG